jgi:hypothetical protein
LKSSRAKRAANFRYGSVWNTRHVAQLESMTPTDGPLIKRADAVVAETARLRAAHQRFQAQVIEQVARMRQLAAQRAPLLPHPPWELGVVRALLASRVK